MDNFKKPIEPFKFWCQTVLPSVYDDSLSYYELLNKVVEKLNEVINTTNEFGVMLDDYNRIMQAGLQKLYDDFLALKEYVDEYFDSLDVEATVEEKLNEMIADGALDGVISEYLPGTVSAWMNEYFDPTTELPLDSSLTIEGAAADAKATGDRINAVETNAMTPKSALAFTTTVDEVVHLDYDDVTTQGHYVIDTGWTTEHGPDGIITLLSVERYSLTSGARYIIQRGYDGRSPYNGKNYIRFKATLLSNWSKWEENVNSLIRDYMDYPLYIPSGTDESIHNGITYVKDGDSIAVSGTADGESFYNLINSSSSVPEPFVAGKTYISNIFSKNVGINIYYYYNNETVNLIRNANTPTLFTIPDNAEGLIVRLNVISDVSVNETVYVNIRNIDNLIINERNLVAYNFGTNLLNYDDTDDVDVDSILFVRVTSSVPSLANWTLNSSGWLLTRTINGKANTGLMQIAYPWSDIDSIKFRTKQNGIWNEWRKLISDNELYGLDYVIYKPTGNDTYELRGVTFVKDGDKITANGTAENGQSYYNFLVTQNSMPKGIEAGGTYVLDVRCANTRVDLYKYVGNELTAITLNIKTPTIFTVPNDATGFLARVLVTRDTTVNNEVVYPTIRNVDKFIFNLFNVNNEKFDYLTYNYGSDLQGYSDVDEINEDSFFFVTVRNNVPLMDNWHLTGPGWLETRTIGGDASVGLIQIAYPWRDTENIIYRVKQRGEWTEWKTIGENVYRQQTVVQDTYNNTYNISVQPTITTDAHGWLQSVDSYTENESNKTDMGPAIMAMLTSTGYCHLSKGLFYVSTPIDMPNNSVLIGCGSGTTIKLLDASTGNYCVKLGNQCIVKDLTFRGAYGTIDISSGNIGSRNGILVTGTSVYSCKVIDCWFRAFNGSGIYQYNTTTTTTGAVTVDNCYFSNCTVGINIFRSSEYCKYSDVVVRECYYACINSGGNNVFTNCTFHGVEGMWLNGQGDTPNSGHGSAIGCTFNHIDNMNHPTEKGMGDAIILEDIENGFIFDGCQLWYGEIRVSNSRGISFNSCLIGGNTPEVEVTGTYGAFFSDCIFKDTPSINVNSKTVFSNCYVSAVGDSNEPVLITV